MWLVFSIRRLLNRVYAFILLLVIVIITIYKQGADMAKTEEMYQCQGPQCGYIYNPDKGCKKKGVAKGVKFEDIPEDFKCPSCGVGKKFFKCLAEEG